MNFIIAINKLNLSFIKVYMIILQIIIIITNFVGGDSLNL